MSPLYEFECSICKKKFDDFKSYKDRHFADCPDCGENTAYKLLSMNVSGQIDSSYRDIRGEKIWFPKDGKPYYDKSLNRTFYTPGEKQMYMKEHGLAMDGSSDKRISQLPPEAGDMKNRDFRKQYKLDD